MRVGLVFLYEETERPLSSGAHNPGKELQAYGEKVAVYKPGSGLSQEPNMPALWSYNSQPPEP